MVKGWRRILVWLPALLWAGYVHYLLASPARAGEPTLLWAFSCNLGHAFLFGVLALLCLVGTAGLSLRPGWRFVLAGGLSLILALAEELVQAGVPSRSASVADLVTGLAGILLVLHGLWALLVRGGLSRWEVATLFLACLAAALESL